MKKVFSLIKASMTQGMNLFRINTKSKNKITKVFLPIILSICLMIVPYSYSEMIMEKLAPINMEFVLLTLAVIIISITTLIEGIYKSSSLLFNCKDDNLLFSLPIKKSTVLFIRVFKFYIFELLYNSLMLVPVMFVYARYMKPDIMYYIISLIGLMIFPIIPILLSCIIGTCITFISSRFKGKSYMQTIVTIIVLIGIMYFSYNSENLLTNIAQNAENINDFITKVYFPAGIYIELITNFSVFKLLEFILSNIAIFTIAIMLIGKFYFSINSNTKTVRKNKSNKKYKIKTSRPMNALIKKEFSRFINSTVFITNAGFGLVLFIIGCILITVKFDTVVNMIKISEIDVSVDYIKNCLPVILLAFISFTSFMTSITSSMISLEGKTFNILKSLPVKPYTIIKSKILAALLIMLPCIFIGDLIVFIKFQFNLLSMLLIIIASVLLPLISATIGIIINLKFPKMDAQNDTEVVKQSMSSAISVFIGMALAGTTVFLLFKSLDTNISNNNIMMIFILTYTIIYSVLSIILHKICDKSFNDIIV